MAALRGTSTLRRLENLARVRTEGVWELLEHNTVLRSLTSAQKTQLQSYLSPHTARENEVLWVDGDSPRRAYLVDDARVAVDYVGEAEPMQPFGAGALVGEFDAMRTGGASTTVARVVGAGKLFAVERADLVRFFDENPGVLLSFLGARSIE
jgi:hypothetical protein